VDDVCKDPVVAPSSLVPDVSLLVPAPDELPEQEAELNAAPTKKTPKTRAGEKRVMFISPLVRNARRSASFRPAPRVNTECVRVSVGVSSSLDAARVPCDTIASSRSR
jgi:hypothetical protein